MPDLSRFRVSQRFTFAAAGDQLVYAPLLAGDRLNVRECTLSTSAAAELVAFFGNAAADRTNPGAAIAGLFLAPNSGASPALDCLGAFSPALGLPIRLYASAACTVWLELAGVVEN